ncbi:hypothetical protein KIPB_014096 [Kipferlia bialata]|uniref:Uncharacterized protein n=1 Tax=Kipferlia bialata TaxID=797122 RepID=A0A9K3DAC1_9EUKA|nr:hypothetical protein KIPB_014096 [Kipferlia bialata]|eukprot:g14096.t1
MGGESDEEISADVLYSPVEHFTQIPAQRRNTDRDHDVIITPCRFVPERLADGRGSVKRSPSKRRSARLPPLGNHPPPSPSFL